MSDGKIPGPFVPLDVSILDDEAIIEAGVDAFALYCGALAFAKRTNRLGYVPVNSLNRCWLDMSFDGIDRMQRAAQALVENQLWTFDGTTYFIDGWERWNATDVARAKAAERQRRSRARRADSEPVSRNGHAPVTPMSHPVTPLEVEVERSRREEEVDIPADAGSETEPTPDQIYFAERLSREWGQELSEAAVRKLNREHGAPAVTAAMRALHGWPPSEAVRDLYAYIHTVAGSNDV